MLTLQLVAIKRAACRARAHICPYGISSTYIHHSSNNLDQVFDKVIEAMERHYRKRRGYSHPVYRPLKSPRGSPHRWAKFRPRQQAAQTNSLTFYSKNWKSRKTNGELGSFTTALIAQGITISEGSTEKGAVTHFVSSVIPGTLKQRYQRMMLKKITMIGHIDTPTPGVWQLNIAKDTDTETQSSGVLRRQDGTLSKLITTGSGDPQTDNQFRFAVMWPTLVVDGGKLSEAGKFSTNVAVEHRFCHMSINSAAAVAADRVFTLVYYLQVDYIGYNRE